MIAAKSTSPYESYRSAGVTKGRLMTKTEFADFWNGITEADRLFWLNQFQVGPTTLSGELLVELVGDLRNGSETKLNSINPALLERLKSRYSSKAI